MSTYVKMGKGLVKCVVGAQIDDTHVGIVIERVENREYQDALGETHKKWMHVGATRMAVNKNRIVEIDDEVTE